MYPTLISGYCVPDFPEVYNSRLHSASENQNSRSYLPPKVVQLFKSQKRVRPPVSRLMNRTVKRPKCFCKEDDCSHEKNFNFIRRRSLYYFSSSDDEIFPEIAKQKKKVLKKKK